MGEMPEECKNSTVVSVHKEVDKQKLENYRRISLLNACYKLYSKVALYHAHCSTFTCMK
jgi:hypothetical protein